MHKLILDTIVDVCKERSKTDCPIPSPFSREQLEEAIIELDNLLEKVCNG